MLTVLILIAIATTAIFIARSMTKAQRQRVQLNLKETASTVSTATKNTLDVNKDGVISTKDVKKVAKNVKDEAGRVKRKYGSRVKKGSKTIKQDK
jgi:hypothetical protein